MGLVVNVSSCLLSMNRNTICSVTKTACFGVTGFAHDAFLAWAYGVNRTLEKDGEPDDGETVAKNIFNFAFTGISGEVML